MARIRFVLFMLFHFIHYNIFEQKANDTCYESNSKHHKCNCEVAAFFYSFAGSKQQ